MTNFVRDSKILWVVKIAASLFQVPATYHVFNKLLAEAGRGQLERYFTSFLAVVLIDALIVVVLYFLESNELSPLDKSAWAFGGIALLIAVFFVGYLDEGLMAFAPRIGVFLLVSIDLFSWSTEFTTFYFSREQIEKRLRNKQVLFRNRQDKKAWREARKKLYPDLVQLQIEREVRLLGLNNEPAVNNTSFTEPVYEAYEEEVEPGVIQLPSGGYGWLKDGEVKTITALGKPYTYQGAKAAYSRSLKNGHNN